MSLKPAYLILLIFIICFLIPSNLFSETLEIDSLQHTTLNLKLMSTIISGDGNSKAILKNPATTDLKGYKVGEKIDLLDNYNLRILRIVPCKIVLEVNGLIERLECEKGEDEVKSELAYLSRNSLDEFE
ncbi:MAG: hypothetical protein ACRENO_09425, partial [Thermodesulfobacteriota bacterium]